MAKNQRAYSEEDKASALAMLDANGGNVFRTARQLGMPRVTLQEWRDGRGTNADVTTSRHLKKGELADRLEEVAHGMVERIFERVSGGISATTPLKDCAVALGIVIDKMQVLRGKPDSIPGTVPTLTPEQHKRIEQLRARREDELEDELEEVKGVQ